MVVKIKNEEVLLRNNTGNKSKETLVDGFAIRIKEFQSMLLKIKNSSNDQIPPHFLIVGQRGAGKTTLLFMLKYAIEDDLDLSSRIIPVIFTEEQYQLSELVNLWESMAAYLEDFKGWANASREMETIVLNSNNYQEEAFKYLEDKLQRKNQRIVLFIENINVFFKKIGAKELLSLKNILTSSKTLQLVGSTTSYFDGFTDFSKPFFYFFNTVRLEGVTKEECELLLIKIGEQYGEEDGIKNIINNHPGRIESLRRLTGGIPRTISYLFQIFLDNENGKAIKDLYILIDTLTFLYKAELDQLSPQQQKVIDVIARKWDAIPVKEISRLTRFESKNISSILSALEKNQFIEIVPTNTKNHLYRIKERFMNIWYLMRYGRKHDKDNIVWLVRFFDAWCDETELAKRIADHINNLADGQYDLKAAIDMGNTFLSCENVPGALKLHLYKITKSKLPERLHNELSLSSKFLDKTFQNLIDLEQYDQALTMLRDIDLKDVHYYRTASNLYFLTSQYSNSAEAAKKIVELDQKDYRAALRLGLIYEEYLHDIDSAVSWLKISLERSRHPYAAIRLGDLYYRRLGDIKLAEHFYNLAIQRKFKRAYISLGRMFLNEKQYEKAEEVFLEAIEAKTPSAYVELARTYDLQNNNKLVKSTLEAGVKNKEKDALINIASWYIEKSRPNYVRAKSYLEQAISEGEKNAYSKLGELYENELNDKEKAYDVYKQGIEEGDAQSAHFLAHSYASENNFDDAIALFQKAYNMGEKGALLCLLTEIYVHGRNDKKGFALQLIEANFKELKKLYKVNLLYARLLLWNNRVAESVKIVENEFADINLLKKESLNTNSETQLSRMISQLSNYFILLLAKGEYSICLDLFENSGDAELKVLLKPIYFVLMECLKEEFPLEYLKAGNEFKETIAEIKSRINKQKLNV